MGSSLDQIGPMTKTVRDSAVVLKVIAGHEPRDSTSSRQPVPDYLEGIEDGVAGLKIGIAPALLESPGLHPGTVDVFRHARRTCKDLGAELVPVDLPHLKYSISAYYIICPCEVSANMARFDGIRYGVKRDGGDMWDCYRKTRGQGFGAEVKRRIIIGAFALSAGYYDAYYKKATQVRTLIAGDFREALGRCDAILMPVTPSPAFRIGELSQEPLKLYLADIFTLSLNLAGLPGICFPAGTVDGLPQGVQLVGKPFDEKLLLRVARGFEKTTHWSLLERIAALGGKLA
jgi:aspartyl-tRNA(Asn)/glutamyl-tRNA(Gln) amidotransferase subunit A